MEDKKKLILIVDDDPQIADLLKEFFELKGFEAAVAKDGIKALDFFKKALPDIVITDLLLPGEHGIDVIRTIKEKYFVPVIIISGIYKKEELENVIEDYFVEGFLQKPVDTDTLLETVNSILNDRAV
jgi:DNA-binding response OmpR family regulator